MVLAVAALISLPLYAAAISPFAPGLTRLLNVPRDRNVGLLAAPLSALGVRLSATPLRSRLTAPGRGGGNVEQGVTDIAKNLGALAVLIGGVALARRAARRRR